MIGNDVQEQSHLFLPEAFDKSGKLLLAPDLWIKPGEIGYVVAVKAPGTGHQ